MTRTRPSSPAIALAFLSDAALVVIFAALGRSSHAREATLLGLAETAWPFLLGLAVSWCVYRAWRAPFDPLRTGVPIWVGTVAIGIILRLFMGAGAELPFVIVAFVVLGAFLMGWRGIAAAVRRLRRGPGGRVESVEH